MGIIEEFNSKQIKKVPEVKPGDTVRVHTKIIEGGKERIQVFEGVVLKTQNGGVNTTITVRKISYGIGVERTFLIHSPRIDKIQVVKRAHVKRANLSYLKNLRGKSARLKDKQFDMLAVNVKEEELAPLDKEEKIDKELTEISEEKDENIEISTEDLEKKEDQKAEKEDSDAATDDEQKLASEEVEEGLEKAEEDLEKGKATEGSKKEKSTEDIKEEK